MIYYFPNKFLEDVFMSKKFQISERQPYIDRYRAGESVISILKDIDIARSTFYNWIHRHSKIKTSTDKLITLHDYTMMLRRLKRVEFENQIFKQSNCTTTTPLEQKLEEIKRLKDQFSIRTLCDVLQVRRSTFLHYLYHRPEVTQLKRNDEFLRNRVADIFEKSQQRFGAYKIKVKLNEEDIIISEKRIQRLMNEMDLKCNRSKPVRKITTERKPYLHDKLNRNFNQCAPNQAWVSDITYCKVGNKKIYICVVIDLFSRKVISHEVSSSMTSSIVSTCFLEAFIHRGQPKDLIFHSDQGGQYKSLAFQKRLKAQNVIQSFSRPGCPHDNAVVESFFAALKKEELYRSRYEIEPELQRAVESYIEFYNNYRPHYSMNYLTPEQVEKNCFEKNETAKNEDKDDK